MSYERLVGRRRVEPVGPPALIQRADWKSGLVVEHQPRDARVVLAERDLAHAEVARHGVDRLAVAHERHTSSHRGTACRATRASAASSFSSIGLANGGLRPRRRLPCPRPEPPRGCESAGRGAATLRRSAAAALRSMSGTIMSRLDRRRRHRLEPDRLPDAGDGRVQDAVGLEHLLAARLRAGVGRIPDGDDEFLLAALLRAHR